MNAELTPDRFLASFRQSHPDMELIFLHGSCFELFRVLKTIWPEARPWHHHQEGHIYVEINGRFYDIRGRVYPDPTALSAVTDSTSGKKSHRWSSSHSYRVDQDEPSNPAVIFLLLLPTSISIWAWLLISFFS